MIHHERRILSWIGWLLAVVCCMVPAGAGAWPVPDSGQTKCYNNNSTMPCPQPGQPFYGQDGNYPGMPRSYTKLDAAGKPLPESATEWSVVRDNVTGLEWEVKTSDGSIHDSGKTFTWCDTNPKTNGGNAGNCSGNDTEVFIATLNGQNFGGHHDWRLPTIKELHTLFNLSLVSPAIDSAWFPHTQSASYWSATTNASFINSAWLVYYYYGDGNGNKSNSYYVRAVRSGQSLDHFVDNGDGTVTDTSRGLMWQQDSGSGLSWSAALAYSESLELAGYSDWRLPAEGELASLFDFGKINPAINTILFPGTQSAASSYYWSATTYANITDYAWSVYSYWGLGDYNNKMNSYNVRSVRSGQCLGDFPISTPAPGTLLVVDDLLPIYWSDQGLGGQVIIELSRQGGKSGSWETLASGAPNSGSFNWLVTGPVTVNAMLRITPKAAPQQSSTQGLFSIVTLDQITITPTVSTNYSSYHLTLAGHYSHDIVEPLDHLLATWSLSASPSTTLSEATLTSQENEVVTVTADYQGHSASETLFLVDPANPDDLEGINDSVDQADPLPAATFWQGQILATDQDWYQLTLTTPALIAIDLTSDSTVADVTIDLLDSSGTVLATTTSSDGARQTLRCGLASGSYHIRLQPAGDIDENGFYTLAWSPLPVSFFEIEANNSAATASPLTKDQETLGLLPAAGDSDYFALSLAKPSLIRFTLASQSTTAAYTVTLFKKGGEAKPLDQLTIQNGKQTSWDQGLTAGDYLLKVTGSAADPQAAYTLAWAESPETNLEIEANDTLATANGLDPAAGRKGRIATADDLDLYGFTMITAGESAVKITLTPESILASYTIELVNAIGTTLATKTVTNGAAAFVQQKLPSGTYYLRVASGGVVDPLASYTVAMTTTAQVTALAKLAGLTATVASEALAVGKSLPLSVMASYSDASTLAVTAIAAYTSSDPGVLTVSPSGMVTGVKDGHAMVTVSYQGKATALTFTVGAPQAAGAKQGHGNLIIVAGGTLSAGDALKAATLHITEMAYQKFQARKFADDDIFFLTQTPFHDLNADGYDDGIVDDPTPTTAELLTAITGWAKGQSSSGPLYLYLADHGVKQQFQVASGQILSAAQLKAGLDTFQKETGRPVVVIIEACYSGSFVQPLATPAFDRLVLTSVDALNPGYLSSDGTISYSAFLLANLYKGNSIGDSLALTKADLKAIPSPYATMAPQMEGAASLQGLKVGGDFVLSGIFPEVKGTTPAQTITAGSTLPLTAEASSLVGGLTVWAVIIPPDYSPPTVSGAFASVVDELPKVVLADEDPTTKLLDGVHGGSYADFLYNGAYTVIFYAKDSDNNLAKSAPVTITVSNGQEVPATTTTTTLAEGTTTTLEGAPTTTTTEGTATTLEETTTTTTTTTTTALPTTTTTLPASVSVTRPLGAGWSLLSSTIAFPVAQVFSDPQKFISVWKWAADGQGGKNWAVYLAAGGSAAYADAKGFSPLAAIAAGEGFWVNSLANQQFTVSGPPLSGPLTLTSGWNLVGPMAKEAFVPADLGAVISVWKWTTVNGVKTWAVYLPGEDGGASYAVGKGFGQLTTINVGEGCWVNVP